MMYLAAVCNGIHAQNDTIRNSITPTVDMIYKSVIPLLERVEITGSSETSTQLRTRWNDIVGYLRNNKDAMAAQVRQLLVSPSGKDIDLDLVRQLIDIQRQDSTTRIKINPDFWIDELQALSKRLNEAALKMAEQTK